MVIRTRRVDFYAFSFALLLIVLIATASRSSMIQFIVIAMYLLTVSYAFKTYIVIKDDYAFFRMRIVLFLLYMLFAALITTSMQIVRGRNYLERTESTLSGLVVFTKISIGAFTILLLWNLFEDTKFWQKFIECFLVFFCSYCFLMEYINHFSTVRESAAAAISKNHISALIYTGIPLLMFCRQYCGKTIFNSLALILSVVTVLLQSSRTAYAVLVGIFIIYFLLNNEHFVKKTALLVVILVVGQWIYLRFSNLIKRGFSFVNISQDDGHREFLRHCAIKKFNSYGTIEKLIGTGSDQIHAWGIVLSIHNFGLELLISVGIIGFIVYALFWSDTVLFMITHTSRKKMGFIVQEAFAFLATGYFQPFYSTSYICGMLFYISIMVFLMAKGEKYE